MSADGWQDEEDGSQNEAVPGFNKSRLSFASLAASDAAELQKKAASVLKFKTFFQEPTATKLTHTHDC